MAAGRLVFPIVMGLFIVFFLGVVTSTPATPATDATSDNLLRVRPGDSVLLEVTGYYGTLGKGSVFFSTQEERTGELLRGDIQPQLQSAPVTYRVQASGTPGALDPYLLNRRAGDKLTTGQIPASSAFGDWTSNVDLTRVIAEIPYNVRYDANSQDPDGQPFTAQSYTDYWKTQGYTLQTGTVWPCEGPGLWQCKVTDLSIPQNTIAYHREAQVGQTFPVEPLWGNVPTGGDMSWDFSVQPGTSTDQFSLRLDPPVGTVFQFRASPGGDLRAGTYQVQSLDAAAVHARYSPATASDPALIGLPVYYDLVIVRVTRAPA